MPLLAFIGMIAFGFIESLRYGINEIPHPEWWEVFVSYILLLIVAFCGVWR